MPEAPVNVAHALCVYAEPLAARRRVVVVGDSSLGLDARLVALGARAVHVYDPDPARAREQAQSAARGVIVRELPAGEFDVREGAFDLAIVPDLSLIEDRAGLLVRVRKLVGPEGSAIVAAKSIPEGGMGAGGLDYYEMYDLVALQFASVRMIGQIPFSGVALAELGETDDEPQVSVDTQLISENEPPDFYIALAAQHDVRLEPYAIVQLPPDAAASPRAHSVHAPGGDSPSEHADLAAAVLRADLAHSQLEEQRALVTRLSLEGERSSRAVELEAALQERTAKLKDAETRAGDHYVRAERLTHDLRRLEEELQRQRDRAARLSKDLDEEKKNRTRAEVDLGMIRKSPDLAQARERTSLLEEGLRAAEEAVGVLQQRAMEADEAIAVRERQIAMLVRELEHTRVAAAAPRVDPEQLAQLSARVESAEGRAALLDAQLAAMAEAEGRELAELERILRERAQTISALEHEVVRRERMVHELVGALEEVHAGHAHAGTPHAESQVDAAAAAAALSAASGALDDLRGELDRGRAENGDLRSKLDALALEVARREGELQARTWRIAELEERVASLEARPLPAAAPPAPAERLTPMQASDEKTARVGEPLRAELNALRQALAQEHAARVAAESGEDLARARADLARQAVLLEQLAGELARERGLGSLGTGRTDDQEPAQAHEDSGQAPRPAQT